MSSVRFTSDATSSRQRSVVVGRATWSFPRRRMGNGVRRQFQQRRGENCLLDILKRVRITFSIDSFCDCSTCVPLGRLFGRPGFKVIWWKLNWSRPVPNAAMFLSRSARNGWFIGTAFDKLRDIATDGIGYVATLKALFDLLQTVQLRISKFCPLRSGNRSNMAGWRRLYRHRARHQGLSASTVGNE